MLPAKRLFRKLPQGLRSRLGVLVRVTTAADVFALTFDDGPHPEWTPRVLDVLARHGARATFFVVGAMVERHPEIVSRALAEGHAVGNHSWNHPSLPCVSRTELARQLDWTRAHPRVADSRLFRPPFGDLDTGVRLTLSMRGLRVIAWDVSTSDWETRSPSEIVEALERRTRPGSIVLMHDHLFAFGPGDERSREHTLQALDTFLTRTALRSVTIPELLESGRPDFRWWHKRSDTAWLLDLRSHDDLGFR